MGQGNSQVKGLKPGMLNDLMARTEFTEEEIHEWYESFQKDYPDGKINREQFKKLYQGLFPQGDSSKFAENVFRTFDVTNDGYINFREFICGFSVTSRGKLDQKLSWAFNLYDKEGNGYISRQEMLEIIQAMYKMVGSDVKMADDENTPEKRTDKIFKQMDKDLDQNISKEEFVRGTIRNPTLLSLIKSDTQ